MEMPEPDASILARRHEIARALRTMVSVDGVIDHAAELSAYILSKCDLELSNFRTHRKHVTLYD